MLELTVVIKGEDSSYKQKHLIYDDVIMTPDDPKIKELIDLALQNAKIIPETIKIKTNMVVQ